jgi:mannose-6-phosphate isomerase-like protein (cupin superfamily)
MPDKIPKSFREKRPWGEELWAMGETPSETPSMVKIISVSPGEASSLQFHHLRDEHWDVISGDGEAQIGEEKIKLQAGSECYIPRETKHRLCGGADTLVLLELSFGRFDEKDIVRLQDKYGRT